MAYNSKYTGAEVDALLDKVAANDVISIDSALSTTSENPVQNKVVTAALNSKVDESRVSQLIAGEHVYLQYREAENKVYYRGFNNLDKWALMQYWVFIVLVQKPLTPHMTIVATDSTTSTNDFELVMSASGYYLTWVYNKKKYTLTISGEVQTIVTQQMGSPSGDPMHYMYEQAGAIWNEETQLWALDEIDDLTTDEVRLIYTKWNKALFPFAYNDGDKIRTIFPFVGYSSNGATNVLNNRNIEIIPPATGHNVISGSIASWFYNCQNLRKIKVVLDNNDFNSANFAACYKLDEVRIERLKKSVSFKDSPLLSNESILYMIEKSNATTGISITLHPDALTRAMEDDAIRAALDAHQYISIGIA